MKKNLWVMGVVLAVVALPAFGAIEYEFTQKTVTEDAILPMTDLTAKAVVDGRRTRVDFRGGTLYPPGTYAVTTDSRRVFFVDPANKSYTEVNIGGAGSALASSGLKIENFKASTERLTDRPLIAGIETDHYRVNVSYDITMRMGNLPLKRHVDTVIESWNTSRFGELAQDFITGGETRHTGNADLDKLFEAVQIPGFPLRQTMTIKTKHDLPQTKSNLQVPPVKTSFRELWVSSIRELRGEGISYTVPATYNRAEMAEAPRAATKTLSFDPEGK